MLLIIGTVRLPPANVERAREAMRAMTLATRAEDGCVEYSYAEDVFERGLIHVKEMWRDQAALDRHFPSGHIGVWRTAWPELGIGNRDLRAYEVGEPRAT